MEFPINYLDEFNIKQNKSAWDILHSHIANILTINHIPLDNVFFVKTPGFIVYLSRLDNSIIQHPASDFSEFVTRKVIIEKCKTPITFNYYFRREPTSEDKITTKPLSVMSYRLNWNKSNYGDEYDLMKALKKFIKSKSHLALFMYVDTNFFDTIQQTKILRVATLDVSVFLEY